ncbi:MULTISPECIES: MATE family efflux transporter [Coprococcus]|uniref:Probable multidrug resistance protein NorM n=1 Tax=Coprococcus eutactus TaxID=33043 RepID=A0AAI9NYI0_9FIRM|nr:MULTISPECIES: MATE family efflux transporter [Coprococcus]MCU6722520.1 MATE family efflux transporter [Coprococcus aceti]GFO94803.1 MATE family efflux transporter [Coprococcus eutactus]CUO13039.1 Na(+)/drug antiporter [Coprococcus eutactus]
MSSSENLLKDMISGKSMTASQQIGLTVRLSIPAILAQISSIVMQYIDASMVGRLGANASGAIGLVSSTTWLFGGLCIAVTTGFTVQIAQAVGAGEEKNARNIMKQGIIIALCISAMLALIAALISTPLPRWLGGEAAIQKMASQYFLVYMLGLPALQMNSIAGGMHQSSGNMRLPGILNVMCCVMDVIFNLFFIFPTRSVQINSITFTMPGLGLGVAGAALGTITAEAVTCAIMVTALLWKNRTLHLRKGEHLRFHRDTLARAVKIGAPVGLEQMVMCSAYVMSTKIVSPLGTIAIAANSFAVTAESFCYMPGYGVQAAATTLVGQCVGAGQKQLSRRMAWITMGLGVSVMTVGGVLMYIAAPAMIGVLTPNEEIRNLGAAVLRIEAFAEPFYAASIVASGALRGAGDTLVPSCMNFASMWCVRIPLAAILAPRVGLYGVWIAMCVELCFRGILFTTRLKRERWMRVFEEK